MLIDRRSWPEHRPWALFVLVVVLVASGWYFYLGAAADRWPGGSSLTGFIFGIVGGLICLFQMLLWSRKQVRTWRIGRAQVWLRAHIWFGLLSAPLLIYHSGFRLGGSLSTVLMAVFLIVIASGIGGLLVQQFLPRRMLFDLPGETVYSLTDGVAELLVKEADRVIETLCGPAQPPAAGKDPELPQPSPGMEGVRDFHRGLLVPYLLQGERTDSPLRFPAGMAAQFRDLRATLPPSARDGLAALEECCNQRRQLDEQRRLQFWLHSWLCVHVPLSVSLIVLMFVHAWAALQYW